VTGRTVKKVLDGRAASDRHGDCVGGAG
jgi:hypothetical protein